MEWAMGRGLKDGEPGAVGEAAVGKPKPKLAGRGKVPSLADRLAELGRDCAELPDIDPRSPDEIIGYDEFGMW
jgi:hypothetical protein